MAHYTFSNMESKMLLDLVERETKRVRELETGEDTGDLRMSEKAIWLADLTHLRGELVKYKGYEEVKHDG